MNRSKEPGLILPFSEVVRECLLLKTLAKPFLDKTTLHVLDEARSTLESIRSSGSPVKTTPWEIRLDRPLQTVPSKGESMPDSKCKHEVVGLFSFIWDIRPLDEGKWKGRKHFAVEGCASTLIRMIELEGDKVTDLGQWTFDVGDDRSPGTHFHYQFNKHEQPPFPTSLDVPRLPAMAMTPFLAMEMAIAELFQDRWKAHAFAEDTDVNAWRNIHKPRIERFLRWQMKRLADAKMGTPWAALKSHKPDSDMLVKDV